MNPIEIEQTLLGAILRAANEGNTELVDYIVPRLSGLLEHKEHKAIFAAINVLHQKSLNPDIVAVADLDKNISVAYIAGLCDMTTVCNVGGSRYHIERLTQCDKLRKMRVIGQSLIDAPEHNATEVLQIAYDRLIDINNPVENIKIYRLPDIINEVRLMAEEAGKPGHIAGHKTGFGDLDRITTGFKPGELTILAGRPSSGKTSLALNIASNICVRNEIPGLFISLEMSRHALIQKLLGAYPGLTISKIIQGNMTADEWSIFSMACNNYYNGKLSITDQTANYYEIEYLIKDSIAQSNARIIFIDHLHLITTGKKDQREIEMLTEITASIKRLARSTGTAIVLLAQLSRANEIRGGWPKLTDLRGCGTIEQDADNVIFIHRPDDPNQEGILLNDGHLIIGKQRMGATGTIKITFNPDQCQFYENSWADSNCRETQGTSRVSRTSVNRHSKDFTVKD